ncbi:MAG: hypothetical protein RJA10_2233 [Pseudomonadota bacterium]|jgi:hypothetical protein
MNTNTIRRAIRALWPARAEADSPWVVQPIGFDDDHLPWLSTVLERAGEVLGRPLVLDRGRGDLVLAEQAFVEQVTPQVLNAFVDERPLVTLGLSSVERADPVRRASQAHGELVRQLRALHQPERAASRQAPSTLSPASGFDSQFDSRHPDARLKEAELDPDRAELLNTLRRGLVDPSQPPLRAGYGPQASLVIDFAAGVAMVDLLADQRLRLAREVPYLSLGAQVVDGAGQRELDLVVWDIAMAAGGFRLLHSPVNWWRAPLIARPKLDISRFSLRPHHRDMARCLAQGPTSPADLRRLSRVGLVDLRAFLQACLFLGLVYWVPERGD